MRLLFLARLAADIGVGRVPLRQVALHGGRDQKTACALPSGLLAGVHRIIGNCPHGLDSAEDSGFVHLCGGGETR